MNDHEVEMGVFCDICGTLFAVSPVGEKVLINEKLLKILQEYEHQGKMIYLWTGGNIDSCREEIRGFGVNWPILEKRNFIGRTMEIVIDDDSEEKIFEVYRIKAEKFILVRSWVYP